MAKRGSTQTFTEIETIAQDIVVLHHGNACLIIEVQASNFLLLSQQEQDAKIAAYANLLNSLSFPIQIVIRNKKIDISSYLSLIDEAVKKEQNSLRRDYMTRYKAFVASLVVQNIVLDKKFYITIPYSSLEQGPLGGRDRKTFAETARSALRAKAETILTQASRAGLGTRVLQEGELVKLAYEMYNEDMGSLRTGEGFGAPIIKPRQTR